MSDFCVFCEILAGNIPGRKVYENDTTLVLGPLPEDCLSRGHLLVIPKEHHANIFDVPQKTLHEVMDMVSYIAQTLKNSGYCDGINIINANETCAEQSVLHLHFHLVPRRNNEKTHLWPKSTYKETLPDDTYKEIFTLLN